MKQRIDLVTIIGLAMLLIPLSTMWHEIGGHAAACAVQGGRVTTIGAFYVDCEGLAGWRDIVVAIAGVGVNTVAALVAYALWRRARGDLARLVLWYVWVGQAFVAAGYFCFSGVSGFGDLGTGTGGSLATLPGAIPIRLGEIVFGIGAYILLVFAAIRALNTMLGTGPDTRGTRRRIAHGYYVVAGASAVLVGLLNPVGLLITILSAAASSFGGLAGLISVGYAVSDSGEAKDFRIARNWVVFGAGALVLAGFAVILGPSIELL
ncbi:hypothetical protein [Sphingomonas sp.]|uniref:hypothetical protein n=1 Tax=Sphingomonas sp. TaxID=28214 RepID=UPI002C34A14D|nr:hypothetical protein [Sphingomonas sp.]HWK34629.1 hypothetical protein [Sphingomonas sp.]